MLLIKIKKTSLFKICALTVMAAFIINLNAVNQAVAVSSEPSRTSSFTIAAESRFDSFFKTNGLDFRNLSAVIYAASSIRKLLIDENVTDDVALEREINRLNALFQPETVQIGREIYFENGSYSITFHFIKESKAVTVVFKKNEELSFNALRDMAKFTDAQDMMTFADIFRSGLYNNAQVRNAKDILKEYKIKENSDHRVVFNDEAVPAYVKWRLHEILIDEFIESFYAEHGANMNRRHAFGDMPGEFEELSAVRDFFKFLGQDDIIAVLAQRMKMKQINVLDLRGKAHIFQAHASYAHGINICSSCGDLGGALVHELMALSGFYDDGFNQRVEELYIRWRDSSGQDAEGALAVRDVMNKTRKRTFSNSELLNKITGDITQLGKGLRAYEIAYWHELIWREQWYGEPFTSVEQMDGLFRENFLTVAISPGTLGEVFFDSGDIRQVPLEIDKDPLTYEPVIDADEPTATISEYRLDDPDHNAAFKINMGQYQDGAKAEAQILSNVCNLVKTYIYKEGDLRNKAEEYIIALIHSRLFSLDDLLLMLRAFEGQRAAEEGENNSNMVSNNLQCAIIEQYLNEETAMLQFSPEEEPISEEENSLREILLFASVLSRQATHLYDKGYLFKLSIDAHLKAYDLIELYMLTLAKFMRYELVAGAQFSLGMLPSVSAAKADQLENTIVEAGRHCERTRSFFSDEVIHQYYLMSEAKREYGHAKNEKERFIIQKLGFEKYPPGEHGVFMRSYREQAEELDFIRRAAERELDDEYQQLVDEEEKRKAVIEKLAEDVTEAALFVSENERDWASFNSENAVDTAEKIHSENLRQAPALPEKTILCHIVTDSILPESQRNMLYTLEKEMRDVSYREKIAVLRTGEQENFMEAVKLIIQRQRELYSYAKVEFIIACPDTETAALVSESGLGLKGLAFEQCQKPAQVEGIMMALRALYKNDLNTLVSVYEILSGNKLDLEKEGIRSLDAFIKKVIFLLPKAEEIDYENSRKLNEIIIKNIKTAA